MNAADIKYLRTCIQYICTYAHNVFVVHTVPLNIIIVRVYAACNIMRISCIDNQAAEYITSDDH